MRTGEMKNAEGYPNPAAAAGRDYYVPEDD